MSSCTFPKAFHKRCCLHTVDAYNFTRVWFWKYRVMHRPMCPFTREFVVIGFSCQCRIVIHDPCIGWSMNRWGSKNKHHKGTCLEEIGLCLWTLSTIPHSIVNTCNWEDLCICLRKQQMCTSNKLLELNKGSYDLPSAFWRWFIINFANATQVLLCEFIQ